MVLLLGLSTASWAQTPPPVEARRVVREGLVFGFGAGLGSMIADCDECRSTFEAFGLDAHIGWMLAPRLALVLDSWAMAHVEDFLVVYQHIATLGLTWWATPRLWVQGGLGYASAGYHWSGIFAEREDRTAFRPGFLVGIGYELHQTRHFTIDARLRYGTGTYGEHVGDDYVVRGHSIALGVGFSWY